MKKDFTPLLIRKNEDIKRAFELLSKSPYQIIFLADEAGKIQGCITDGDIRRALLKGETLQSKVDKVARLNFVSAKKTGKKDELISLMKKHGVRQLPVLDDEGKLLNVVVLDTLYENGDLKIPVVMMAGGKGTRLLPLTDTVPKALLKVGGTPVIETTIGNLAKKGVEDFYIIVGHLGEQIVNHLGGGEKFGCKITYFQESVALGTAGGLGFVKRVIRDDFLLLNADVISDVDFSLLYQFHQEHSSMATICSKKFNVNIPFGVLETKDGVVASIDEKPELSFTVSSGIHCLSSKVLKFVKENEYLDMPVLMHQLLAANERVMCFQSLEPWIDIGSHLDFERAQKYLNIILR